MKTVLTWVMLVSFGAAAQSRQAALSDMQSTWGFVPAFMKAMPEAALPGVWEQMKELELSNDSALPRKYKELIGLAVSSQIPCEYCIYAHTEFAKAHGAAKQELGTAVAVAAVTRQWSTFLNGAKIDEAKFKSDVNAMAEHLKKSMEPGAPPPPPMAQVSDAEGALKDIELHMGLVPDFMRRFPATALPGAWRLMRDVDMNPNGPMPPKYLALTGLAVASQVPCSYCILADTERAKALGATEAEIYEAVALASFTRAMSTLLNGMQLDFAAFKGDVAKLTKPKGKKQAALLRQ